MLPIFENYRKMLKDTCGLDLSQYDDDKLWIDRMIIRGFNLQGKEVKICRLKVTDDLEYEYKFYDKSYSNDELLTYEQVYLLFEDAIRERERESINLIKEKVNDFYLDNYKIVLPTSMGKDSKLVEYLYNKSTNLPKDTIFNNTTMDCIDVYKEVKSNDYIKIITPKDKGGKNKSFFNIVTTTTTTPSRMNRWCCDIFKEKPTEEYYSEYKKVLYIYGMRNEESAKRADYQDIIHNDKWKNSHDLWYGLLPIRKWTELELWLYTIHNNIPINSKYTKGYSRVGCHCCCPFYTKSTWILDKYWYPYNYNRWQNFVEKDFKNGEKWTRMNCTLKEFRLNWNGGQVRKAPTEEVIKEFMEYKGLDDKNLAKQYFEKSCMDCGKKVYKQNEIAMNLKMFGRAINQFKCKKCLMKEFNWTKEDWDNQVKRFKDQDCHLF